VPVAKKLKKNCKGIKDLLNFEIMLSKDNHKSIVSDLNRKNNLDLNGCSALPKELKSHKIKNI
jgi:hypothetical protein